MPQLVFVFMCFTCVFGRASAMNRTATAIAICDQVDEQIPNRISYPSSSAYNESTSSYFSGQETGLRPSCIFSPKDVSEVSKFVKLMGAHSGHGHPNTLSPQFAIRSGGHTPWSGAANIDGGITVDLRAMDAWALSPDRDVASIGGGVIWSDIYPQLIPYNLTVMGGRVVSVGVGGYLTGGGISILSRQHGWSCDNVYGYEVVLASGEIVYATAHSYPDLWLALKGGSNNFGIVTRFDVPTWPLWKLWGGALSFNYTPAVLEAQRNGFSDFMDPENFDDNASMFFALYYQSNGVGRSVLNVLFYAMAVTHPSIFDAFTSIPDPVSNTLRLANVSDIISEQAGTLSPNANRAVYIAFSFRNPSSEVYNDLIQIWEDVTETLYNIEALELGLLFQPHPVSNGTNSLGLPAAETDLVLAALTGSYANTSDDDTVLNALQFIQIRIEKVLRREGVYIPFQYLNYAYKTQDPIGSYGKESKARLQEVSKKYDPSGLFQTMVPGGFKLFQ